MVCLALERVQPRLPARRLELEALQHAISEAREAEALSEAHNVPYFSKLPVELISEVFLFATEMDSAFPALACLICPAWRAVALSLSFIWQCVTLSNRNPVRKLKLWQERSKHRITCLRIRHTISMPQLSDALAVSGPSFLASLKSLHCDMDVLALTDRLLFMPNLQDLDLEDVLLSPRNWHQHDSTPIQIGVLVPLNRMSSIRSFTLDHVIVDWSFVTPRLSQLRILVIRSLEGPSIQQMCALLAGNPHLKKVILETGLVIEEEGFSRKDRILLSQLSHLELLGPMNAASLVGQLSLPRLECFAVSHSLSLADRVMHALEPSPVALTEFSMDTCSFSAVHLAPFLQTMPRLTKLEITHSASAIDSVVYAVAGTQNINGETRLVCPALKHVNFSHCLNLNGGPLVRLVKPRLTEIVDASSSRSPVAPAKIDVVLIDGCPKIDPSVPEWLRNRVRRVSCIYMTRKEARQIRQ